MKLIKPSFEIWEQEPGLVGIYKAIEKAGRVCYRSEDKITEDSAKPFVDRMIKSGHGAMLEHGTIYLAIPMTTYAPEAVSIYRHNSYSKVNECNKFIFTDKYGDKVAAWCVTTNLRVLVENDCLEDLEFLCEPTEFHEKRITVKFILSRSIAQEYTRHRVFSFAMESQRYCNYSTDKFSSEVTFIQPCWLEDNQYAYDRWCFCESLSKSEEVYFRLLNHGWKPQQAREVLPNACKTELVMTGFVEDWKHFLELRCASNAHPQAQELAIPLRQEFIDKNIW